MTIDDLRDEIEELRTAHRALAAQHTALMAICRVMLPLIDSDPEQTRQLLISAYDIYGEHMETAGQDADYQRDVRSGIDLLTKPIYAAADIRVRRQSDPS